jgi:hypothetical protein
MAWRGISTMLRQYFGRLVTTAQCAVRNPSCAFVKLRRHTLKIVTLSGEIPEHSGTGYRKKIKNIFTAQGRINYILKRIGGDMRFG